MKSARLTAALLLMAAALSAVAPSVEAQTPAQQLAYTPPQYRCTIQHPSGKRYCYKVPTLRRSTVTL